MVSIKMIFLFATFVVGLVIAQDYDGGGYGDFEGYEGGDDGGGYSGGDYGEGGEDDGAYAAAAQNGEGNEETASDDGEESAAASNPRIVRVLKSASRHRRSLNSDDSKNAHIRVRRGYGHGVVGPVYTYAKTDYHGNFKWGVKHNVGKQYGHGGYGK